MNSPLAQVLENLKLFGRPKVQSSLDYQQMLKRNKQKRRSISASNRITNFSNQLLAELDLV